MAFTNKVVTDAADFQAKMKADIIAAGWTNEWSRTTTLTDPVTGEVLAVSEFTLKSPTGVLVSFREAVENSNHLAHTDFVCAVSLDPNAGSMIQHPGTGPVQSIVLSGNLGMEYWLSVTNNRINLMWKISASYFVATAGRFLPFALPTEYPYPLLVGSTTRGVRDWRDNSLDTFIRPGTLSADICSAFMDVSGQWNDIKRVTDSSDNVGYYMPANGSRTFMTKDTAYYSGDPSKADYHEVLGPCLGGGHHIADVMIQYCGPSENYNEGITYGVIDGFRSVLGRGQVPENNITVDTLNLITCQNVVANGENDYYAMEKV